MHVIMSKYTCTFTYTGKESLEGVTSVHVLHAKDPLLPPLPPSAKMLEAETCEFTRGITWTSAVVLTLTSCTGTIDAFPPSVRFLEIKGGKLNWSVLCKAIENSNIQYLKFTKVFMPSEDQRELKISKLVSIVFEKSPVFFHAARAMARAAEQCDILHIEFDPAPGDANIDLTRTRALTRFGDSRVTGRALVARRMFAVLGSRLVLEDGDHACMHRVLGLLITTL